MEYKKCLNCNKEFSTYPSLKRIKFCSRKCYYSYKIGEKRPEWVKSKISLTMKEKGLCGPVRYGKNCNFWKGGVDLKNKTLYRLIRDLKEYKHWRKAVFERDNYTCQICGQYGMKLEADHYPFMFSTILNTFIGLKSPKDSLKIEFLWDIENGRTLCKSCHKKYGIQRYKNNKRKGETLFEVVSGMSQ